MTDKQIRRRGALREVGTGGTRTLMMRNPAGFLYYGINFARE